MDRSTAFEQMRDSNLERRTEFLPGELAKVYAQTVEDLGRQRGRRSDLELGEGKYDAAQLAADELGISKTNLNRYVRLTYLIPELLSMVNEKRIKFQPAVELSFLNENAPSTGIINLQIAVNGHVVYEVERFGRNSHQIPDYTEEAVG